MDWPPSCRPMAHRLQLRLLTWDVKDTLLRLRHPVGVEYAAKARAHGILVCVSCRRPGGWAGAGVCEGLGVPSLVSGIGKSHCSFS